MKVSLTRTREFPTLPRIKAGPATLVSVLAGLLVAFTELDHLVAQVLQDGQSRSPTQLTGLTSLWHPGRTGNGLEFLAGEARALDHRVAGWMWGYAALDVAFAIGLGLALWWLTGTLDRAWELRRRIGRGAAATYSAADVLENLLMASGVEPTWLVIIATWVKWVGVVAALAILLVGGRKSLGRGSRWLPAALYTHRYSALIVVPLAALGISRGPDILEQIPDIQRAWADGGGFAHFLAAAVTMVVLMGVAFAIGRQRTHHLWLRTSAGADAQAIEGEPLRPAPLLSVWFLGPALLVAAALFVNWNGADIGRVRLVAFCTLPLVVGGLSWGLRRISLWAALHDRELGWLPSRPHRKVVVLDRFRAAAWMGDLLVGLLPVVAGLGSIRAFTAVVALGEANALAVFYLVSGVGVLVGTWPVLTWLLRLMAERAEGLGRPAPDAPPASIGDRILALLTPGLSLDFEPEDSMLRRQAASWAFLATAVVAVVVVATLPVPLAEGAGVIATFQLALGALSLLIASAVILFQAGGAPELFWFVRLPFVPTTSLVVATALFAGTVGNGPDVHGIRLNPGAPLTATDRPDLDALFTTWLTDGTECAVGIDAAGGRDLNVRPLLLYAAEGGGIRAAYWTTAAIDRIVQSALAQGRSAVCGSAFLSSGASGGSVGLSIASRTEPGSAAAATTAISGPEALGAAADGLVLRDTIFAATGIPVPSYRDPHGAAYDWADRGTLIEHAWRAPDELSRFDEPWVDARTSWSDWGPPGAMVLNSTSATTGCRALLSQADLPASRSGGECEPVIDAAGSTDLIGCAGNLHTTTVALLTARFPYVTPSGVVECGEEDLQIVDGGYAENTGVGTLVDLAPRLLETVQRHNSCVVAGGVGASCDGAPDTVVVPTLVYFDNGTGSDLVEQPAGLALEIVIPPITALGAKASLYSARSQLQRAEAALATDRLWDQSLPASPSVLEAVDQWRERPVYVIHQATEPSIAAPLGWVLSKASRDTMDEALDDPDVPDDLGFGSLRELNARLK